MEIKINKEIRGYKETIFFGLSFRQFACSILAVGAAVGLYFGLKDVLGGKPSAGCALWVLPPLRRRAFSTITA
jgi:hypothetical protein